MVYDILDYGLPEDQERALSQPLENLIEMMTELEGTERYICRQPLHSAYIICFMNYLQ